MKKFKNAVCSILVVIALFLAANLNLTMFVANSIREMAHAEYKSADTITPYEFDTNSGFGEYSNGESGSALYSAFTDLSRVRVDMYDMQSAENQLLYKPTTKYNGDNLILGADEQRNPAIDDFAMTIQANKAPVQTVVNKKDDNGNVKYEKDADGNFLYVSRQYTQADYDQDQELYSPAGDGEHYYKKIVESTENGVRTFKQDSAGNYIYEAEVFSTNNGDTNLFVQIEQTNTYYKKIPQTETVASYFGYRTYSTISMRADSWYVVSFWIWTQNADAAILVTSGENFEAAMQISNTEGEWKHCYFFLENASNSTNNVTITLLYGSKDDIVGGPNGTSFTTTDAESGTQVTSGAIFVDNLCFKTISQTDYINNTLDGERDENIIYDRYSARYDYIENLATLINKDFSNELEIYEHMYGDGQFDADQSQTKAYQYFVSRYSDDAGEEERSENQLSSLRRAYKDYFKAEIVSESEEIKVDEKDADGNVVNGDDGKPNQVNGPSTFGADNKVLKLENTSQESSAVDLGLLSRRLTLQQFGYYRLTVYLKGLTVNDKATVKLLSTIETAASGEKGKQIVASQDVTPYTDNSDITNNWTEVSFYIQSSCYYDTYFQIALIANAESTIYFDNIRLEHISSETYTSQASAVRYDLSPSTTVVSSKVTNGYFDKIVTSKADPEKNELPYTPETWSKLDGVSDSVKAGIVPTTTSFYSVAQEKIGNASNPMTTEIIDGVPVDMPKTNILAIYSPTPTEENTPEEREKGFYYGFKSGQFSLSSNSVMKVTFSVFASLDTDQDANFSGKVFANLVYANEHIAEFVDNYAIDSAQKGQWITYTIYVRTGADSRLCSLELGVKDAKGTIFFKDVDYTSLVEKDNPEDSEDKITIDEQYDQAFATYPTDGSQKDAHIRFVSFGRNQFAMHSTDKVEGKDYYSSLSHALLEADEDDDPIIQGEMGVFDTAAALNLGEGYNFEANALKNPAVSDTSTWAMLIYNDENYNTTVYPNSNETLNASAYYKISVWVRTINVPENAGLTIAMNNVSARFENVNTEHGDYGDLSENNGYKKFTVLVRTGSTSITGLRIGFMLGTEGSKTTGMAVVTGLEIESIKDQDTYDELVEAVDSNDTSTIVKNFFVQSETTGDTDADNLTLATFFLVFSSILLVAALVFAIVAVYFKRRPKNAQASQQGQDAAPKDGFV